MSYTMKKDRRNWMRAFWPLFIVFSHRSECATKNVGGGLVVEHHPSSYWEQPFSQPYFDNTTKRETTTTVGQSAYLHCRVRNLGDRAVSWIRKRDLHILTVGILTYTNDQRFQSLHSDGSDEWTLKISSPQVRDSGTYECQVSTEPKISLAYKLNVVVSKAKIVGNPELYIRSGSDINLTCIVLQTPEPPSFIFWYRGEHVINYSQRGGINVVTDKQTRTSRLLISRALPADSGNYTCAPSTAESASVLVHVLNGSFLTNQCLQGRFGFTKRDLDSTLTLSPSITKFRDTKEGFQIIADAYSDLDGISQEARWPTECQVIQEKIRHIEYAPATPEPYYVPTGKEPKPKPVGDEFGTVIFRYCPTSSTNYFSRSCVGRTVLVPEPAALTVSSSNTTDGPLSMYANGSFSSTDLRFESRFESGNLGKVIKITDTYYQLYLRRDLYTQRHMQWYYFRISNTKSRTIYRLSIVNFCKEDSLYNEGLRPLLYSTKDATMHAVGWRRCGDNITYYRNDSSDEEKEKHTLTFNVSFPHDQDTVYLAHSYPHTYTDLQEYLGTIVADPVKMKFTKLRLLCRTLAGNNVYYLTITAPTINEEARKKKGVVITARVHPGETPSSWMMKGIIDFLTGESNQAKELREKFIFKLIPMLNPDGVIVGNNRCSLSGKDLNRQYRTVMRESYPSVWHTKLMIRRLMEECGITIYCDLHAHSRKHNIFIYGCESKRTGYCGKLTEQVFPLMLHKNAADKFSFENCKFHIEKGKEGTGRVVMWLMGVQNSYTMEASLGGSKIGSRAGTHFSTQDYEQIGKAFCETLLDFSDEDPTKERLRNKIIARLMKEGSSADEPTNIALTDYSSDEGDTSASSSEEDRIEMIETVERNIEKERKDCRYLCVPSSSPLFPRAQSTSRLRKAKKKVAAEKSPPVPRKPFIHRAVMDLPTADPGSDLCDLTDSGDDGNLYQLNQITRRKAGSHRNYKKKSNRLDKECNVKKDCTTECLSLPSIVRPRSLSLGEELVAPTTLCKNKQRLRCLPLSRTTRNLTSILPKNEDVQIKLTALRQQIWTGVSLDSQERDSDGPSMKYPLSWGLSALTLAYQTDSEILLKSDPLYFECPSMKSVKQRIERFYTSRSCSKKLEAIDYSHKAEMKKLKKRSLKKQTKIINIMPVDDAPEDEVQKPIKKKRTRFKRQKAINPSFNATETNAALDRTERLDSFKLFGTAKLQKSEIKQGANPRRKFCKGSTVATVMVNVSEHRPKSIEEPIGNNSSSDNAPDIIRSRTVKKKKKKKTMGRKKRASSANIIFAEIKPEEK